MIVVVISVIEKDCLPTTPPSFLLKILCSVCQQPLFFYESLQSCFSDMFPMKPSHCRNDSGELDVFEAARYFSGSIEVTWRPAEMIVTKSTSPDMPIKATQTPQQPQMVEEDKKCKEPTSPSGRLAAFLNIFFHQAAPKKKSKSHVGEESHGGRMRRRRRSTSISLSQCIRSSDSDDSSTATRALKSFPNQESKPKPVTLSQQQRDPWDVKRVTNDQPWLHEGPNFIRFVRGREDFSDGSMENRSAWKRNDDQEEENRSDTSSDLFELKSYLLGDVSSDLPGFGRTDWKNVAI